MKKMNCFFANLTPLAGKWVSLGVDLHHRNCTTAVGKPIGKALDSNFGGIGERSGVQVAIQHSQGQTNF